MNARDRIATAVSNTVNRVAGELITLNPNSDNLSIWAVIDRVNKPFNKVDSEIRVQGDVGITVYIMKRHLNTPPRVGMIVQESDAAETEHTIGEIKDLGFRWQCFCSSEPIT